jgi:hypothetical protein
MGWSMRARSTWFLGICFLIMVGAVAGALGPDFFAAVRSYTWRETPCTIVQSRIAEEPFSRTVTHYVLKVEYTYSFAGMDYRGTRFTTGDRQGSSDAKSAEQAATRFHAGARTSCFVNPGQPSEAVLVRGELWGGLFLLGPFLIAGLVMHESIFAWFDRRRWRDRLEHDLPLSEANDALRSDGRVILFGVLGTVMGTFLLGFCLVAPLQEWSRARQWVERTAVITRCELTSRSGLHGPEYSVELLYEYDFGGRRYRGSRRNFSVPLDEAVADLAAWVATHPIGTRTRCLVNPRDPTDAVLEAHFNVGWIPLSLGLLMFGVGITMGVQSWRLRRLRLLSGPVLEEYSTGKLNQAPTELYVRPSPWMLAGGCLLAVPPLAAAGCWSLQKGLRGLIQGQGDIINLLYGAGATIGAVWCARQSWRLMRQALRPRPTLRLSTTTPRVGESFQLEWKLRGTQGSVNWMRLWLEGTEYAKARELIHGHYGPISEEKTQQQRFESFLLSERQGPDCDSGELVAAVPAGTMHTFRGAKCGVTWNLRMEYGRDDSEKLQYAFPIVVLPGKS